MKRLIWISLASLGLLVLGPAGKATAQIAYPNYQRPLSPIPSPALSPYLDLRRGGNPAIEYFQGTLPEFDRRANTLQFRGAILELDRRVNLLSEAEGLGPALRETGHPAYFANLGPYYNFNPLGRGIQGTAPVTPSTSAPAAPGARRPR